MLLWFTAVPKIPPWIWLLPHCGEERGTGHQHSQQHQYLHQYQHQHQQDASSQGQSCFSCASIIQEKLVLHVCCFFQNGCNLVLTIWHHLLSIMLCHHIDLLYTVTFVNCLIFVFQDSESSMSEDTGLGSEETSSCECLTAV